MNKEDLLKQNKIAHNIADYLYHIDLSTYTYVYRNGAIYYNPLFYFEGGCWGMITNITL